VNVILCGFHWTGCSALQQLLAAGHRVHVFTHEASYPVPSLVDYCRQTGTPYSLDDVSRVPLPFQPDVIASIYYRYLIKPPVIAACGGKIFNLHPSLLPKYRGCSSLTWAMVNGETETGFTYHYVDEGCDTGRILLQERMAIEPWDTQATLYARVQFQAMTKFAAVVGMVAAGAPGEVQTGPSSYYRRGCPHEGVIDSRWDDAMAQRFIRAMINPPYPPAKYLDCEIRSLADLEAARLRHREKDTTAA
jgi:methionyl-tRNA formyltransferase